MPVRKVFFPSVLLLCLLPALFLGCGSVEQRDTRRMESQPDRAGIRSPESVAPRSAAVRRGIAGPSISDTAALEEPLLPEPASTEAEEIEKLLSLGAWEEGNPPGGAPEVEVGYDFPITMNRHVEFYLDFFKNEKKDMFYRWLNRSGRYLPMIEEELRRAGLPRDLAYLAMIESGFIEVAYSPAKAAGMWQFIGSTGRNYGLAVNDHVDERRDPVKATRAAVAYLSDLYTEFGSWYLAVAGYNAGEGKIRKAIERHQTTNFWDLAKGDYLKMETKLYVPKLIAAILIARNPAKYGFDNVEYQEPLAYDLVEVPRWTSLSAVALACDEEVETLRLLNRQLLRPVTPPDEAVYELKVPPGKRALALNNLPRVRAMVATDYKTHTVDRGDTLTSVSRRYGLSKTVLLKANPLRNGQLQVGQRLRIPYQTTTYELLPEGVAGRDTRLTAGGDDFILHKVQPGETLSHIATRYNLPSRLIADWNGIKDVQRIRAGSMLALYVRPAVETRTTAAGRTVRPERVKSRVAAAAEKESPPAPASREAYHTVQSGETLWTIAREYRLDVARVMALNKLADSTIRPGDRLLVSDAEPAPAGVPAMQETYYMVQGGDSLWTIARKHSLSPAEIKQWNNLKDDVIHPGSRLLLKLALDVDA